MKKPDPKPSAFPSKKNLRKFYTITLAFRVITLLVRNKGFKPILEELGNYAPTIRSRKKSSKDSGSANRFWKGNNKPN